jgi:hypothetical protein
MKTAVEYIKKRIEEDSDTSFLNIDWNKFDEIINKAKEMEKEQSNAKIQKAIEKFEELQSKASSLKDVIYLGGVLSALEVIKNETFKQ